MRSSFDLLRDRGRPRLRSAGFPVVLCLVAGCAGLLASDDPVLPSSFGTGNFIRGDADQSATIEITDAIFSLNYLYSGAVEPSCLDALDTDDNGQIELTDVLGILDYLFLGNFEPSPPFPGSGIDPTPDGLTCDNGAFGRIRREVLAKGCAASSCHSSLASQGGLVLEGYPAYSNLFQTPPEDAAARSAGFLRVKPGDPDGSFLYRKLTGDPGAGERGHMSQVGSNISTEHLELIRRWIQDSAAPSIPQDITLPRPTRGEQVLVPYFPVPMGGETQRQYYFKLKNAGSLYVDRIEFLYPPGSHRLNLFASDSITRPDGSYEETFGGVSFDFWAMKASTQTGRMDWRLPPGVTIPFKPFQQVMAQIHFANTGPQVSPIGGCAVINLHGTDPGASPILMGNLFCQNKNVLLPPRSVTTWDYGVTFTRFRHNTDVKAAAITGHFHWRGKTFEVRRWDGLNKNDDGSPQSGEFERMGVENRIYLSEDWNEPPFVTFGGDGPEFPRGWGVVYRCVYANDSDDVIQFGPMAAVNEHSNLFVYFYPGPANGGTFSFPLPYQQ